MVAQLSFAADKWKCTIKTLKTTLCAGCSGLLVSLVACIALFQPTPVSAESVAVRYIEGLSRGFLVVHGQDGRQIAEGDLSQFSSGDRVTSRMTFRFKDGSVEEETTVFSQHRTFRLLSDHVIQKGPAFKMPMETSIDATTVSYLAATPKPRIVHLVITPHGEEAFSTGISKHKAIDYEVRVVIGGMSGVFAHLFGKQPSDTNVWVLLGDAPTFVGLEGPFYAEGPIWRVDLASPVRNGPVPNK